MKKLLVALIILLTVAPVFALNTVELGAKYYANPASSRALFNADIYVGEPDLDPEVVANQKTLSVLQENGNVVAVAQPISTGSGGVPLYNGSYVTLLVEGDYSIKVLDSVGSQIYYVPNTSASATGATFEDWVISTTYGKNAFVVGSDDRLYYSLAGGNIGNDPTSTLGFWQISSNFDGFGSNSRHDQYAGDLDAILNNSIYNVNAGSVTNEPVGLTAFGFIHTMMHVTATTNGTQILYSMNSGDGKIWIRHRASSAWGAWIIVYTETTLPAPTEVQADNSVVVLDGGTDGTDATFTGDVTGNLTGEITTSEYQAIYHGRISSAGAALRLPSGWSSLRNSIGSYTITHNLNDGDSYTLVITYGVGYSGLLLDANNVCSTTTNNNDFSVRVETVAGVLVDTFLSFIVVHEP